MTNTIEIENLNISDLDIPTDETLQEVATACENIATSCDNVATACGDIAKDTTLQSTNTALGSLATDATLQATNTALGGLNTSVGGIIKDATLQTTNTALASLMADTTGQSIASAISGLGAALGSDRALIDGSNIGDKATFRSNIEASGIIICENRSKTTGLPTFSPNTANVVTINLDKSGYTPYGIIEITGSGTTGLVLQEFYISNNVAYVYFRNLTSSNITPSLIRVRIIYFKD